MGCTCRAIPRRPTFAGADGITYPTNVAQAVQWSHDNPLKQAMLLFRRYLTSRGTLASNHGGLSTIDGVDGRKPAMGAKPGDAFLAQPQDVMDSVQRLRHWRNKPAR